MTKIIVDTRDGEVIAILSNEDSTFVSDTRPVEFQKELVDERTFGEIMRAMRDTARAKLPDEFDPRTEGDEEVIIGKMFFDEAAGECDAQPLPLEEGTGQPLTGTALVQKKFEEFVERTGKGPADPIQVQEMAQVVGEAVQEEFG